MSFLNQKNFEGFFNISGRLAAARWNPTAKNIVSGPLVQPQRPAQKPDHQRLVPCLRQSSGHARGSCLILRPPTKFYHWTMWEIQAF